MQTISHVYDSYGLARAAIEELEAMGVASSDISLMANRFASTAHEDDEDLSATGTVAGLGAIAGGSAGLLAGLGLVIVPGLGPVIAAGWLVATAIGAAAGAMAGAAVGGLVDTLQEYGEPHEHAHVYAEAVRRGGTLVTVRVQDIDAPRAREILAKHDPVDPVSRGQEYREGGWTGFDPAAQPYRPSEAEIERIRMKGYL